MTSELCPALTLKPLASKMQPTKACCESAHTNTYTPYHIYRNHNSEHDATEIDTQ